MDKYSFDTDFDAELEREVVARREAALRAKIPTFLQEDLDSAIQRGSKDGFEKGQAAALESIQQQTLAAIQHLTQQLPTLFDEHRKAIQTIHQQSFDLVKATIQRLAPHYVETYGLDEVKAFLEQSLDACLMKPTVVLTLNPNYEETLKPYFETLLKENRFEGELIIEKNDALGPGDCKLSWGLEGGGEHSLSTLLQRIEDFINKTDTQENPQNTAPEAETVPETPETGEETPNEDKKPVDIEAGTQEHEPVEVVADSVTDSADTPAQETTPEVTQEVIQEIAPEDAQEEQTEESPDINPAPDSEEASEPTIQPDTTNEPS